jgi:NCAIR mutase (PurE)-related protein
MNDVSGYATPDFGRTSRCGFPEVVYAAGKTPEQVAGIMHTLLDHSPVVLATRVDATCATTVCAIIPDAHWASRSQLLFVDRRWGQGDSLGLAPEHQTCLDAVGRLSIDAPTGSTTSKAATLPTAGSYDLDALLTGGAGHVVVCCAGTSDLAVAEEAALTARLMGSHVTLVHDIGIAGVHRVLEHEGLLRDARAIIVVAGFEGALPSLIAGLVDVPVFAVPTSVGYGACFGGIAALLGMLTSCSGGVSVVNIDNGFGAGQCAHRVNIPPARFTAERVTGDAPAGGLSDGDGSAPDGPEARCKQDDLTGGSR